MHTGEMVWISAAGRLLLRLRLEYGKQATELPGPEHQDVAGAGQTVFDAFIYAPRRRTC